MRNKGNIESFVAGYKYEDFVEFDKGIQTKDGRVKLFNKIGNYKLEVNENESNWSLEYFFGDREVETRISKWPGMRLFFRIYADKRRQAVRRDFTGRGTDL
jgi:hypothetical protein